MNAEQLSSLVSAAAKALEWNTESVSKFVIDLLEDCNMHEEAERVSSIFNEMDNDH